MLKLLVASLVMMTLALCSVDDLSVPLNPTNDELELMSQELRKRELAQMALDAENLKIDLLSPRTTPQRRVEAAAQIKKIYDTTRFELYKAAFKESIRMLGVSIDKLSSQSCGEMGVHQDNLEDKYLKENCKKAVKMVWGMLLADRLKGSLPPFSTVKNTIRDYLSNRLNATIPFTSSN